MKSTHSSFGKKTRGFAPVFFPVILAVIGLGLAGDIVLAGEIKGTHEFTKASRFDLAKDWKLKAENHRTSETCARAPERGLTGLKRIAVEVWCRSVGLVLDTPAAMAASAVLFNTGISDVGKDHHRDKRVASQTATKISREQAVQIALKVIPGEAKDVAIEKKLGKTVYVLPSGFAITRL